MPYLSSSQLIRIMQRTLNRVDARLMGHGERVALLVSHTLSQLPELGAQERSKLCILGLLHDIGAYKTSEIDQLLSFEAADVSEHSLYGYLFLKNLSPLGAFSRPVLYHHLPYHSYGTARVALAAEDYAGLLTLADRADIVAKQEGPLFCKNWMKENRGTLFSPYWVDLFLAAEEHCSLLTRVADGVYDRDFEHMVEAMDIDEAQLGHYLSLIAYAIDFRSRHMVLHTVNTVSISLVMGERLGLDAQQLKAMEYGALLHDVGKVATPVEILEKPGRLTPAEMDIMRTHVVSTREILQGLIHPEILEIACRHHERMDGTGYPQALTMEVLTLSERILAVADVVSALIRQRSYKEAFDKATTLDILTVLGRRNQPCPMAVDTVVAHFDEIIGVAQRYGMPITQLYESIQQEYNEMLLRLSHLLV